MPYYISVIQGSCDEMVGTEMRMTRNSDSQLAWSRLYSTLRALASTGWKEELTPPQSCPLTLTTPHTHTTEKNITCILTHITKSKADKIKYDSH